MFKTGRPLTVLVLVLAFAAAAQAQAPRAFAFHATNYNVEVVLRPEDQTLVGQAKVDFVADQVSKTLVVELHPDLKISSVHVPGGKPLEFDRDKNYPLLVDVGLPEVASPGKQVTLVFEYCKQDLKQLIDSNNGFLRPNMIKVSFSRPPSVLTFRDSHTHIR